MSSDATDGEQKPHLFKKGQSGNPAGRPKGSRNKLGEDFLEDLYDLWKREGRNILTDAREEKPMEFAKMVAGLLPKELLVRKAPETEMSDEEIADALDVLRELVTGGGERPHKPTHSGSGKA